MELDKDASNDDFIALQRRLAFEARLLDCENYEAWIDLMDEDIRYIAPMPKRVFRESKDKQSEDEFHAHIFDDTKEILQMRIKRLTSGMVWCENPKNPSRHIVSNVEVFLIDGQPEQRKVLSVLSLFRSRQNGEQKIFAASRSDIWRIVEANWLLLRREIEFDFSVVRDSNLNILF